MLLAALGIAWIGSVLAAAAPAYGVLIVGRLLQAAPIPCLFLSYSLIRDVYPPRTVPLAVSICTGGLGLAAVVTPFLNGWLLDTWGWRASVRWTGSRCLRKPRPCGDVRTSSLAALPLAG
jgi:MFS family permease